MPGGEMEHPGSNPLILSTAPLMYIILLMVAAVIDSENEQFSLVASM